MPEAAVTVAEAARTLGVTRQTVRRWLRQGARSAAPGTVGRGHGAMVSVADLEDWKARRAGVSGGGSHVLDHVAVGLLDVFIRDGGDGAPLHRSLGIGERQAAALLVSAFERIYRHVVGKDAEQLPPEMERLFSICVESSHLRNFR